MTAVEDSRGERRQVRTSVEYTVDVTVDVSEYGIAGLDVLPVVGGGGRLGVTFGAGGEPVGVRGVWRPPVGEPTELPVIGVRTANERFRELTAAANVVEFSSYLAYYSAPAFSEQSLLYPVYVYRATVESNGSRVPMRNVYLPATEVGADMQPGPGQPPRRAAARPRVRPLPDGLNLRPGSAVPSGLVVNRRLLRDQGMQLSDLLVAKPGDPGVAIVNPNLTLVKLRELENLFGHYSAGTSWIGLSGGLAGSQDNARGFVDGLAAAGWSIRFNWGDANAWESDWRRNDDEWVDAVDFVFYTGHANMNGWSLANPDDGSLQFTETAGAADLWGAQNLEWAVIAACGPLQDEAVAKGGGNALDRWRNAFDGLHLLLGYGAATSDTTEEGRRLIQYARGGATLMQAWFRTAQEIQSGPNGYPAPDGPEVWAGACYLGDASGHTANDHLWGYGPVGPDILTPTWRGCSWVRC
ncbi:MAG TPA: DUF6345 domain-containing protein [Marmoricola sp.]|nr:DUF6345 domain-containing protein [Marmoricola sp.]